MLYCLHTSSSLCDLDCPSLMVRLDSAVRLSTHKHVLLVRNSVGQWLLSFLSFFFLFAKMLCAENQDMPLLTWLPSQQFGSSHTDSAVFTSEPYTHPCLSHDTLITFTILFYLTDFFFFSHFSCVPFSNRNGNSCCRRSLLSLSIEWNCFCLKQNVAYRGKILVWPRSQYTELYCYRGPWKETYVMQMHTRI